MSATLTTRPADGGRPAGEAWIVCIAATRDVVDGMVLCPLAGPVSLRDCRDCRFLEALEDDWHRPDCTTPDG